MNKFNIFGDHLWSILKWLVNSWLKIGIIIILLIIAGYFGYQKYSASNTQPTYQTAVVEKGSLITSVTASGSVTSGNSGSITTQASGVVVGVYVKNGDTVFQGQKIADIRLDQSGSVKQASAYASLVSAQTAYTNAQNNLRSAEATLTKTLDDIHLYQYGNGGFSNVGSGSETQEQRQQRTSAEVAKDNATNTLKTAQAQLAAAGLTYQESSSTIYAPINGIVGNLSIFEGNVINTSTDSSSDSNSSKAQSVGTVMVGESKLQAIVNLSEVDVTKVKAGQKVTMTMDAFPDKTFTGSISWINTAGSVTSGVTTYPATITFDSAIEGIYPNMAVSGTIITDIKDSVILVPASAITTSNGVSTVRVMKNNIITSVTVELGSTNGTQTEIISGINEGDTIVTSQISATTTTTTGTSPFSGLNRGFGGGGAGTVRTISR